MRTLNKYNDIEQLPAEALPVSQFAKRQGFSAPSYVYHKYDRYKFGVTIGRGKNKKTRYYPHPGYDIVTFNGICFVINY